MEVTQEKQDDKTVKIDITRTNVEDSISIVIVNKDKPEYLNICLQSIAVNSSNNNYEIIVVDNASGPETQTFLDDLEKDVKVVRNDKNLYFSAAANLGFRHANKNSKYVIFMHYDVVILNPASPLT
jgi:GT2 family glycosyltransferase